MIGYGTQDTRGEAVDFVNDRGTESFTMLWDPTFESWISLDISGQPTLVLLDPQGNELGRWFGLNEGEILNLIDANA